MGRKPFQTQRKEPPSHEVPPFHPPAGSYALPADADRHAGCAMTRHNLCRVEALPPRTNAPAGTAVTLRVFGDNNAASKGAPTIVHMTWRVVEALYGELSTLRAREFERSLRSLER